MTDSQHYPLNLYLSHKLENISLLPKSTSHLDIQAIAQGYRFYTRPDVRTGLLWKIPLKRAFRDHNSPFSIRGASYGFSLISLAGKQYKMEEHREKSPIPFLL